MIIIITMMKLTTTLTTTTIISTTILRAKCKSNHKPWLTPGLVNACKKKNNPYRVFLNAGQKNVKLNTKCTKIS